MRFVLETYMKKNKIIVSISLLVSNRRETIRKCMESLKPLLEAIPSELIAVDTGCTDGAIDIVREYTDKIVNFTWCNDFSAARNAGLKLARGEWFLYIDDDEWFEDISEIVAFFQTGEYKRYDRAWYIQRNYSNREGTDYVDFCAGRLSKIVPGLRFEKRIHEGLYPTLPRMKGFSCYVHHYGYLFDSIEQRDKHAERNISLLEIEVKENPKDFRMIAQLAQEYSGVNRLEEEEKLCRDTLKKYNAYSSNPFLQYLMLCLVRMEMKKENWELAQERLQEIQEKYSLNLLTQLACAVEQIEITRGRQEFALLLMQIPSYFSLYEKVKKLGDTVNGELVMNFASYLSEVKKQKIILLGIEAMEQQQDFTLATMLFSYINWKEAEKTVLTLRIIEKLVQCYIITGEAKAFFPYCKQILENTDFYTIMIGKIEHVDATLVKKEEENVYKRIQFLKGICDLRRTEPLFLLFQLEYALSMENVYEIKEKIDNYFIESKGKYDARMVALFLDSPDFVNEVIKRVDMDTFCQGVKVYLKNNCIKRIFDLLKSLEEVWDSKRLLFLSYLKMVLYEEYALTEEQKSVEVLWKYVEATITYAESYFAKTLLENKNRKALPRNCQFAYWMKESMECKKIGDKKGWSEYIKQASVCYPPMIPLVQAVLQEEAQKKKRVSAEMQQLAKELKKAIYDLLAIGQKEQAKELVLGLEQYVPEDEDLEKLKDMLSL